MRSFLRTLLGFLGNDTLLEILYGVSPEGPQAPEGVDATPPGAVESPTDSQASPTGSAATEPSSKERFDGSA